MSSDPWLDLLDDDVEEDAPSVEEAFELPQELVSVVRGDRRVKLGPAPRRHVITVPFGDRFISSRYSLVRLPDKTTVFEGVEVPRDLMDYASPPYSWERWIEEGLNAGKAVSAPARVPVVERLTLRKHQTTVVSTALAARNNGDRGFLIADDVGLGKTLSSVGTVLEGGYTTALVLAPFSALDQWRDSIASLDTTGKVRWVVINYDRAKSLLVAPKSAATAKRTNTKNKRTAADGVSKVAWDVVIQDESQMLANPVAQRTSATRRLTGEGSDFQSFNLWLSATAGQEPLALSYLAPILTAGKPVKDLDAFAAYCRSKGINITKGAYGKWEWGAIPTGASPAQIAVIEARKQADLKIMHGLLFGGPIPKAIRRQPENIAGWPKAQRSLMPIDIGPEGRRLYQSAWLDFRHEQGLEKRGKNPKNALARQMRFRQKAEMLRVPGMADACKTQLGLGFQAAMSFEFLESIEAFVEAMGAEPVVVITGSVLGPARERERLRFQRGDARVVAYNITAAISLHAGDRLAKGNDVPRSAITGTRWSGTAILQIGGRTHRDGQFSLNRIAHASGTFEERVTKAMLKRIRDVGTLNGDDTTESAMMIEEFAEKMELSAGVWL